MSTAGTAVFEEGASARRTDLVLAGIGVALGLAAMAVDHLLGDDPGLEDPLTFAISAAFILGIVALLFGVLIPRTANPQRAGLIVALVSVVSLPLIWLGAPFAIAPAAIALGKRGRGRTSAAAVAIGVLVLLLATAAYVFEAVNKVA